MTYRFEVRSIIPGDYRWVTGFFAGTPSSGDVREGIDTGDGVTGVLDLPSVARVISGIIFDNFSLTGIFVVPTTDQVESGIEYGAYTEYTGVLGAGNYPAITDVREGVGYGYDGYVGTLSLPVVGDVRLGVQYDDENALVGTLWLPTVGNVRQSVGYGTLGTEYVGTYICDDSIIPGSTTVITSAFKTLYVTMIDQLLADNALTVPCTLIYGDTKFTDCPNCYLLPNGQSSGRYKTGGPIPFDHGACPYCHNLGRIPETSEETIYLAAIFDSKSWIKWSVKDLPSPYSPDMYVQTISKLSDTYSKLKRAKHVIIDNTVDDYNSSRYERYSEPEPVGLGNSTYIFTMWKKVG